MYPPPRLPDVRPPKHAATASSQQGGLAWWLRRNPSKAAVCCSLLLLGVWYFFGLGRKCDDFMRKGFHEYDESAQFYAHWPAMKLVESVRSDYQLVEMYHSSFFGYVLVIDGALMTTEKDEENYHEMIVHVPLNYNPNGTSAVVIGGGDGGTVRQLLRHPNIKKITMVEIDHEVVDMSMKYFTRLAPGFHDPRLELVYTDGAAWVKKQVEMHPGTYDFFFVDSTDFGVATTLFTDDFFNDVKKLLKPTGILVTNLDSPSWSLHSVSAVSLQMHDRFKHSYVYQAYIPTFTSGHYSFTFNSDYYDPSSMKVDWAAWRAKNIKTSYYSPGVHYGAFSLPPFVNTVVSRPFRLEKLLDLS